MVSQFHQVGQGQAGRLQLAPHHSQRERRAIDRHRDTLAGQRPQQVGQSPDVVLVGVSDHTALDPVGPLQQPGEVREHRVDPGKVVGEQLPAVQQHDASLGLQGSAVTTDLAQPAQER